MGLHYIDQDLMDDQVDIAKPEALVYELDADGEIAGSSPRVHRAGRARGPARPPQLFGMDFHQHPTLPLWVLHTWLWKDNPTGIFQDWNPAVRQCLAGVPIEPPWVGWRLLTRNSCQEPAVGADARGRGRGSPAVWQWSLFRLRVRG